MYEAQRVILTILLLPVVHEALPNDWFRSKTLTFQIKIHQSVECFLLATIHNHSHFYQSKCKHSANNDGNWIFEVFSSGYILVL